MKKLLSLTVAATVLASAPALAAPNGIHTGGAKGAYFNNIGPMVAAVLSSSPSKEIVDAGVLPNGPLYMDLAVLPSTGGTAGNIQKCGANPMDVCLGQGDLVAKESGFTVIPTGAKECLYAVTKDNTITAVQSAGNRVPIAVQGGSGSEATFQEAADAGLTFLPVVSRQFLRYEVNGQKPYSIQQEINVKPGSLWKLGGDAQTVTTACVDVVVFFQDPETSGLTGNDKLDMEDISASLKAASTAGLLIPSTGDWRDLFGKLRGMADSGLEKALDKLEKETGVALK